MPWAYLDVTTQWDNFLGVARGILNLRNSHFINLMAHIGRVPTTKQIASSKIDISLGCWKKSSKIHLMSDSMLIINFMKGLVQVQDILLNPIYYSFLIFKYRFRSFGPDFDNIDLR